MYKRKEQIQITQFVKQKWETSYRFHDRKEIKCLNTKLLERKGKLRTYTYANNAETQIDYILINKK